MEQFGWGRCIKLGIDASKPYTVVQVKGSPMEYRVLVAYEDIMCKLSESIKKVQEQYGRTELFESKLREMLEGDFGLVN